MKTKTCPCCNGKFADTPENFYPKIPYCKACQYQKNRENAAIRARRKPVEQIYEYHDESELKGLEKGSNEYVRKWNQIHKTARSQDYEVRVEILKGTEPRTVVM